jgi:hypothetical protein
MIELCRGLLFCLSNRLSSLGHLHIAHLHPELPLAHVRDRHTSADVRLRKRRKPYNRPPATDFPVLFVHCTVAVRYAAHAQSPKHSTVGRSDCENPGIDDEHASPQARRFCNVLPEFLCLCVSNAFTAIKSARRKGDRT